MECLSHLDSDLSEGACGEGAGMCLHNVGKETSIPSSYHSSCEQGQHVFASAGPVTQDPSLIYGVHGNQAMVWDPFSLGNSFYGSFPKPAWPVHESAVSQLLSNQLLCSSH